MNIIIREETKRTVIQMVQSGNKIEAIKLVREESGSDLKEAKDYVESLIDSHNAQLPDNQKIPKSGCVIVLLIVLGFAGILLNTLKLS